ncbi:MAG: LON peptidase substrate-binding domain-containing protein, partial [Bacteroidales bacterium]|nr:LON peptidase substrate-binding domain-containing protein [Bacteroidales bacterium]
MIQDKDFNFQAGAEVSIIPVLQGDNVMKFDESELPDVLPILALRNAAVFPGAIFPITIGREKSMRLIRDAEKGNFFIGAVPQYEVMVEEPQEEDLSRFGTVCKIMKTLEMPDGTITAILQAFMRFELESVIGYEPYITAKIHYRPDLLNSDNNSTDIKAIAENLKERAIQILRGMNMGTRETIGALKAIEDFKFLVNFIATTIEVENFTAKVDLLSYDDVKLRSLKLLSMLDVQIELLKLKQEINQKVKSDMDQQQREYFLNNQLRTIQEELGMDDSEEFNRFRERAASKKWPKEMNDVFNKELAKLERYNPSSPDYSVQYNYIDFMLQLPWGEMSTDNLDLKHAQKVLDEDHFGLDTVKERIIEYLAVLKLKGNMKSPILCLYGPPGVGKTSLGKSIARSLGRKYVRIALGGMHDEAEIRGHRKTYVGALPGRILNGIARAGTSNPVIVLDEIDKLSSDFKGDPSSALLEALDPEQN